VDDGEYIKAFFLSRFEHFQPKAELKLDDDIKLTTITEKEKEHMKEERLKLVNIENIWCSEKKDYTINLRMHCREYGFFCEDERIINRRYKNYPQSFKFYSQRLRIVGMSYDRTMFAQAFNLDGSINPDYIKSKFKCVKMWLFDDAYEFDPGTTFLDSGTGTMEGLVESWLLDEKGKLGERVFMFSSEIIKNVNDDVTLCDEQKDLFFYYFDLYHNKMRGCISMLYLTLYWALGIFLVCLWFSWSFLSDGIYEYILSGFNYDSLESNFDPGVAEYTHVLVIFVVLYIFVFIVVFITHILKWCYKFVTLNEKKKKIH
jgi:hypothetical protein